MTKYAEENYFNTELTASNSWVDVTKEPHVFNDEFARDELIDDPH